MQVVGYDTTSDTPALLVADEGVVSRLTLAPGTTLAHTLGDRHCAGTVEYDVGTHRACGRERAPRCERHTVPWSVASNRDSTEEHAIYLAAFAPREFKVGVTRSWRLETRLREQGADRAAHVHTVADGRIARDRETEIAAEHGLTERVRVPTKLRGLAEAVDIEAWNDLLSAFDVIETFAFEYGLGLRERPVVETLLTGTVRGTKGRVLVLDYDGTTYAVDLRDLVGHELAEGATDRELQSSLGRFR